MAVTVVATPGAADANSFATVAEITAYYEARVPIEVADEWVEATPNEKAAAAVMATLWITSLIEWTGYPTSTTQSLPWPRTGMLKRSELEYVPDTEVPQEVKNLQAELARVLLGTDRLSENDIQANAITYLRAGPVTLKFSDTKSASGLGVIPEPFFNLLVPSWYENLFGVKSPNIELERA